MSKYLKRNGDEYYSIVDGKETYAFNSKGHQIYAKKGKREFYAKDEHSKPYYAQDNQQNQYYARTGAIEIGGKKIYAKDSKNAEIYPKYADGREYALEDNGRTYYAKDENSIETYPKDMFGEEYIVENKQIKLEGDKIKLPTASDGRPIYSKVGKREVYLMDADSKYYFCKNRDGDEVYAKDENGHEYYPTPETYAKNRHGEFYYALDKTNHFRYPEGNLGEMYITTLKGSVQILKNSKQHYVTYAKQGKVEIYPVNGKKMEIVMDDIYANVLDNGINYPYYPRDSNSNEYIAGDFIEEKGYPITVDGYIIIPNIDNKPKFFRKEILEFSKLLYRPDTKGYDFLTNVKSKRPAESLSSTYKTLDLPTNKIKLFYYIIAALVTVIIVLLMMLTF